MARVIVGPGEQLLAAFGVKEKYVQSARLTWTIGEPVVLELVYLPTGDDGAPMLDPAENTQALVAAKRYKLVEIEDD